MRNELDSAQLLTRKAVNYFNLTVTAGFLTYPIFRQPSRPGLTGQWQKRAGDFDQIMAGAYSSGYCPGFTPGSLLSPDFRQKTGAPSPVQR